MRSNTLIIALTSILILSSTESKAQHHYVLEGKTDTLTLSWTWSGLDTAGNQETLRQFEIYRSVNNSPFTLYVTTKDTTITLIFDPNNQGDISFVVAAVDTAGNYSTFTHMLQTKFVWGSTTSKADNTKPQKATKLIIKQK